MFVRLNTRPVVAMAMCLLASLLTGARLVYADAAPKWTDAELVGFSDLIVRGTVSQVRVGRDDRIGALYTYVTLNVADVLKGPALDRRIVLKQLGGRLGATALQISGQPTFTVGEEILAFLEVRPRDRTLTTTAQWQGKFTIVSGPDGGALAMREDPGMPRRGVFGGETRVANTWIADLRSMIRQTTASVTARTLTVTPSEVTSATAIVMDERSIPATWGDARRAVRVDTAAPGQPALGAEGGERELARAAQFWTNTGLIAFDTGGLQPSGCFIAREADGRITVGIDSCGELNPQGGTIAISGRWTRDEDGPAGVLVARIVGAGVITNAGANASRLLGRSACFERLATHELGHTLGLIHSEDGNGPMDALLQCPSRFGTLVLPSSGRSNQTASLKSELLPTVVRPTLVPLQPMAPVAAATASTYQRVSVASGGAQSDGWSYHPSVSADDRFVAFDSTATNLVPGDTNGLSDIFVFDRFTGITTRESIGLGGVEANAPSSYPSISANGRFVAFQSSATNLVSDIAGSQIYVRDRQLGVTIVASISSSGIPGNEDSYSASISGDGRFVSFLSVADNLVPGDTNGILDVFTHELVSGATSLDSVALNGASAPSITSDGRYVAFTSSRDEIRGVFLRDRIAGQTSLESIGPDGQPVGSVRASISPDGRFVAFLEGPLYSGLYVRDRLAATTTYVSLGNTHISNGRLSADGRLLAFSSAYFGGYPGDVSVYDQVSGQFSYFGPMSRSYLTLEQPAIGTSSVAFSSEYPLVTQDTNGTIDIYVASVSQRGAATPPADLSFTLAGSTLTLTWTAPSGDLPTAYVIEAGTRSGISDVANFSTGSTATSFSATVSGGGTYYVRVRAANAAGVSAASNEITVALGAIPGAPVGLTVSVTQSSVTLMWLPPASGAASSYVIEAGSAPGLRDLANFSTGTAATTFMATNVPAGTYFLRVRAANFGGSGPPSNEVAVVVVTIACSLPGAPSGLTRSVVGSTVMLNWTAGTGATSYILEVGSAASGTDIRVTDLSLPATTLTSTGVGAGTYFVRLRSTNLCGQSGLSNEAVVIVSPSP
jgi:Tol biopolymer transport system component